MWELPRRVFDIYPWRDLARIGPEPPLRPGPGDQAAAPWPGALRQWEYREDRGGTSFYARRILRDGLVQAADAFGQRIRDIRCRASQDLQEARRPQPNARLLGENGGRAKGQPDAAAES